MSNSNQSYNKLRTNEEIIKYYKQTLNELKTKRYKYNNSYKIKFLDEEIKKIEQIIKNIKNEN